MLREHPERIADYFLVIGLDPEIVPLQVCVPRVYLIFQGPLLPASLPFGVGP